MVWSCLLGQETFDPAKEVHCNGRNVLLKADLVS